MSEWTTAARAELERYCERVRASLSASGADAAEVIDDLRRHVDEEVAAAKLTVVTEEDVRRLVARLGVPEPPAAHGASASTPAPPSTGPAAMQPPRRPGLVLLLFGVLLPAVTLGMEWTTGMCAGTFFDPIPTLWHALLVALVPVSNALTWLALRGGRVEHRATLGWANGVALGVALFYAMLFLPLAVPGLVAIIVYGLGLLPLAPLSAFICASVLRGRLRRLGQGDSPAPLAGLWPGMIVAWLALLPVEAPVLITRAGLDLATEDDPKTQLRGLRWLRAVGDEQTLLRACYGRTRRAESMDLRDWLVSGRRTITPEAARMVYYRVTGRPFNAVPAPNVRTARGRWAALDDWTWDADQAGSAVGGRVSGLTLRRSRLDAVVEPDAALAYFEWTLEFRNDAARQREARAQVLLPPGGVVSRLTLWVNGEEREAAFAGRAQVRAAYESVVQQRRDPVLVTTCGPDRLLVQCFPVPPDGGRMKVRLGVTASFVLASPEQGLLRWPCLLERNFTIPSYLYHSVWIESSQPLSSTCQALQPEQPKPGLFALRGLLTDLALGAPESCVRARRDGAATTAWTKDTCAAEPQVIRQIISPSIGHPPTRVIFVVDASRGMDHLYSNIAQTLGKLPPEIELGLVMADDLATVQSGFALSTNATAHGQLGARLLRTKALGGQDNVPALVRAWDLAAQKAGCAIVWVHGPQPLELEAADALRQRYDRRPRGPELYEIQTAPGPNRVAERLDGLAAVRAVPRFGELGQDLDRLLASWIGQATNYVLARERLKDEPSSLVADTRPASPHLARLWAHDEVQRLRAAGQTAAAVELARRYQLVTPVSGAVVLETAQQYAQAGLQPAEPSTVPAIPEPCTWAMWLLGLGALWLAVKRRSLVAG